MISKKQVVTWNDWFFGIENETYVEHFTNVDIFTSDYSENRKLEFHEDTFNFTSSSDIFSRTLGPRAAESFFDKPLNWYIMKNITSNRENTDVKIPVKM